MARRHMAPYEWGAAFEQLCALREVRTGKQGRQKAKTEKTATVAVLATELGVPERTARNRLALADDFATLEPESQDAVRAGEKTVKGAKRDEAHAAQ